MALFTEHANRERNPLGGREADGFGQWLMTMAANATEAQGVLTGSRPTDHIGRCIAAGADDHYGTVRDAWRDVQRGWDELARDHFEVALISKLMSAHDAVDYARRGNHGPKEIMPGGRPVADLAAEYVRACMILAQYLGVDGLAVAACGGDQDALSALRNTRAGATG